MKNILITGVSSGIGKETARFFLSKAIYRVFGTVRKDSDAILLKEELGNNFMPLIMDVTDQQSINKAFKIIKKKCRNGLALLINNAGIAIAGPMKHITAEEFRYQMQVNVTGVLNVTNAFLPILGAELDSEFEPGRIINISSVSGLFNAPFLGPYCISKHALESMSDTYRRELSIYGIKVIVVEPGPIKSEIWRKTSDITDKYLETDYGEIWKGMSKRVAKSEQNALPTRVLSKKIYNIFLRRNPAPRYIVTKNKLGNWLFFYLTPNRLVDFFISKSLRNIVKR